MKNHNCRIARPLFAISSILLFMGPLLFDAFIYSDDMEYFISAVTTAIITFVTFFLVASLTNLNQFIKEKPWVCYFALMITAEISSRLTVNGHLSEISPSIICVFSFIFAIIALKDKGFWGLFYTFLAAVPLIVISYITRYATGLFICLVSMFIISLLACSLGWYKKFGFLLKMEYFSLCYLVVIGLLFVMMSTYSYSFNRVFDTLFNENGGAIVNLTIRDVISSADVFVPIAKTSFCIDKTFYWYGLFNHRYIITFATHNFGLVAMISIIAVILIMLICGYILSKQKSGLEKYASVAAMTIFTSYLSLYIIQNLGFAPFTIYSISDLSSTLLFVTLTSIVLYDKKNFSFDSLWESVYLRCHDDIKPTDSKIIKFENIRRD